MKTIGGYLIQKERERQIEEEGFDSKHDNQHSFKELIAAAISYCAINLNIDGSKELSESIWPWDKKWYKPKNTLRDLTRAGALIAAAIDKIKNEDEHQ